MQEIEKVKVLQSEREALKLRTKGKRDRKEGGKSYRDGLP